ncbi:helix-turn-helix domain-containing protein [Thalassobacter stenotrophicus]|uniref:helix-turn-helix domain-containing protein n=1 Tax=Thalassobacter stenotrophicus TaxID=266809 RepID=UPI0009E7EEBC
MRQVYPRGLLLNLAGGKAQEMFETTQCPVDQISRQVGYRDPAAFRKVFLRLTGLVPQSYRQRFAVGS